MIASAPGGGSSARRTLACGSARNTSYSAQVTSRRPIQKPAAPASPGTGAISNVTLDPGTVAV